MYEEQKMEYDRVKFPNELISVIKISNNETRTSLKKGDLVFNTILGYVTLQPETADTLPAVLVEDWNKSEGKNPNAIISGNVDSSFVYAYVGGERKMILEAYEGDLVSFNNELQYAHSTLVLTKTI